MSSGDFSVEVDVHASSGSGLFALLSPVVSFALLIALWALAVEVFDIEPYLLPSPDVVASRLVEDRELLATNAEATTTVALLGFVISLFLGIGLGLLIARYRAVRQLTMPAILATQSVPKIALAPLLIVWFGFGTLPKLIVAVLVTFFPILLGTILGVERTPRSAVELARSMGLRGPRLLWRVVLPHAAPAIGTAVRLSATLALIGALFAEFVASEKGLGTVILMAAGTQDTALTLAAVVVISVLGILMYVGASLMVRLATRGLGPWMHEGHA
jgi:NitT/TauT family transport system permease protein